MSKNTRERFDNSVVDQPPTHADDPFLGVTEAAAQLSTTHTTIRRWVMQDRLMKAVMFPGGRLMIRQSEINRWKTNYVHGGIHKETE
jgi:excisionase family DNA binding protein